MEDQDITFSAGNFKAVPRLFESGLDILIDPDYIVPLNMIDETGTVVNVSFERGLMHEFIHAVDGLRDEPSTDNISISELIALSDYRGSTVNRTNTIMSEYGESTGRVSYSAASSRLTLGDELSLNENIDAAFLASGTFDMTTSGRSTRDVLFGSSSEDNLLGGGGRDFLHGFAGNDLLTGGEGDDYINGGAGDDTAVYEGICTDYTYSYSGGRLTVTDNRSSATDGTDTLEDVEFLEFSDGTRATVGSDSVACPGQSVLLAIDVSGSMGDDIAAVQQSATALVETLFGTEEAPVASRLAIITFNDRNAFRTELKFTDQQDIAERKAAALEAIGNVSILGGGAEPLNGAVLSGLTGDAGPWVPGMIANRVIVFSDEPAADPELRAQVIAAAKDLKIGLATGETPTGAGSNTGANIIADGEIVNPYTPAEIRSTASVFSVFIGDDASAQSDFEDLATATGGSVVAAPTAADTVQALTLLLSPQIDFNGTDADETLTANVNDNVIKAEAGDDIVLGLAGADTVTLGAGADIAAGMLADLYGDTITDFSGEDQIRIDDTVLSRSSLGFDATTGAMAVDTDNDGTAEGSLTLQGDFSAGDFMAARLETSTVVTFENYLGLLGEGSKVEAAAINGIINAEYLNGFNTADMSVSFEADAAAGFSNTVGYYEIDSAENLVNITILAQDAKIATGAVEISVTDEENDIGFFLVQDGANMIDAAEFAADSFDFVSDGEGGFELTSQGVVLDDTEVFFSHDAALNSDGQEHVMSGVSADGEGALRIGFEDLLRDGTSDDDFQDVILFVDIA
ncbi:DUF4114 domain-containing protein [uncultured Sulfitobacter sp.]|uniref:DUF4114 domain-containing protein n=1 Tax=uncultured Sulfitobacter sp. TaxID=191468 RepID=UPI002635AA55|nr:DUF4114 domain-containing protein [uncultured Sulfitobacter sp.]